MPLPVRNFRPGRAADLTVVAVVAAMFAVAVRMVMLDEPLQNEIYQDYGLSRAALAGGSWWVVVTHAFLHHGWWHLVLNTLSLLVVGLACVRLCGGWAFVLVLLGGILAGGMVQMLVDRQGTLIGMSGGIFALVGALAFRAGRDRVGIRLPGATLGVQGRWLGVGVLLASVALMAWSLATDSGRSIGHACHTGGAIFGALAVAVGGPVRRVIHARAGNV